MWIFNLSNVLMYFYSLIILYFFFFFLMIRRPPRSTRTDTLFPYTTLFRSHPVGRVDPHGQPRLAHLERPDPLGEPEMREAVGATDRQDRHMVLRQRGEPLPHLVEGAGHDRRDLPPPVGQRSEERRVGKECVSACRSRWSPYH